MLYSSIVRTTTVSPTHSTVQSASSKAKGEVLLRFALDTGNKAKDSQTSQTHRSRGNTVTDGFMPACAISAIRMASPAAKACVQDDTSLT